MCLALINYSNMRNNTNSLNNFSLTSNKYLTFLTNNVRGIQSSKKRKRLIKYFKIKLNHDGVLFSQETNSSIKNENAWVNDFSSPVFFLSRCI